MIYDDFLGGILQNIDEFTEFGHDDYSPEDFAWLQKNNVNITKAADNCGTGAGGFQPGNDCAEGHGRPPVDDSQSKAPSKEEIKKWADNHFGDPETARRFVEWFEGSQVVDENGDPIVVYHGTARPDRVGNVFDPERATSGPMPFFTDNPEVAGNYATSKEDTSLEQPADYAEWYETEIRGRKRDIKQTWYALSRAEKAEIAEKLPHVTNYNKDGVETDEYRLGGPDEYGVAGKGHWDWTINQDSRGNVLEAAKKIWLDGGGLFGREKEFTEILELGGMKTPVKLKDPNASYPAVYAVHLNIKKPLDTSNIPDRVVDAIEQASYNAPPPERYGADQWDKDTRNPEQWVEGLKKRDKYIWTSIPDFVTEALVEEGYDGIKDTGGKMGGVGHDVWIPFRSEQVKSSVANSTFDPNDPHINKSASSHSNKAFDKCEGDECNCDEEVKTYEWPDAVRKYRLNIEGLADDLARYKAEAGDQSADSNVRDEEPKTPAMSIEAVCAGIFKKVMRRIEQALRNGKITPVKAKAVMGRDREVIALLEDMTDLEGDAFDDLYEAIKKAIEGGQQAGLDRLTKLIAQSGRSQRIRVAASREISKRLEQIVLQRAKGLVDSMLKDTVERFVEGMDADFSIDEEIQRLKTDYGMSRGRAQVIARTESANAYHEGQIDTWKQSGVIKRKHFFIAAGACQFCQAVNNEYGVGKKSLAVDAPMVRGGVTIRGTRGGTYTPKFDSPGIVHPNCRCDFVPVLEGF